MVTVNEMQFGFVPEKGTIDAEFILIRLHKEYPAVRTVYIVCT